MPILKKLIVFFSTNWLLIPIFLLALFIRFYSVSGNTIQFWFDQSRDAVVSREIIEKKDIKIQGPSASGTKDTVYHGALYYYIVAPLYTFSGGSPVFVSFGLAFIGSLAIILIFHLTKEITHSKEVAYIAATLHAVSFVHIQESTWLSNPQLLIITVPFFYYYLWKIFKGTKKISDYGLAGLFFGLSIQVAIFEVFLAASIVVVYLWKAIAQKKIFVVSLKEFFVFLLAFIISTASMILTEFLMIKRGILTPEAISTFEKHSLPFFETLKSSVSLYSKVTNSILAPGLNQFILVIFLLPIIFFLIQSNKQLKTWLLLYLLAPAVLLFFHYRDSVQTLFSIETPIYIAWAFGLYAIVKKYLYKNLIVAVALLLFAVINVSALIDAKTKKYHYAVIQKGASLSDQMELIDTMYRIADTNAFSFSTSSTPYGVNTTWSYLFNWYGLKKYQRMPDFYGPTQNDIFGEGLVPETTKNHPIHFTILEPDTGLNQRLYTEFLDAQASAAGSPSAELEFGTLVLQVRNQNSQ